MAGFIGGTGVGYPTSMTEIGLAIEATKGTLAAAPSYMFPIKAPKYKPDLMFIPDETLQGSMVQIYDEIEGMRYDGHGWDAPPYLDSFPVLVRAELGSADTKTAAPTSTTLAASAAAAATTVSCTGSIAAGSIIVIGSGVTIESHLTTTVSGSGPYTVGLSVPLQFAQASGATVTGLTKHQFSLLNTGTGQPPSCSLWDNDSEEWRTMTACQLDELTLKGNATGLIDYTTTWFGNAASLNASAPVTSYTGTSTPAPWSTSILLGGTQIATLVDWSFNLKRGVKPIPALTGTQAYFEYFANTLQCSGKVTFVEQSGTPYLTDYLSGTKQSIDISFFDIYSGEFFNLHSTSSIFSTGELDRSKEWVEVTCDIQPLPSAADATAGGKSPLIVTIGNAVTTSY